MTDKTPEELAAKHIYDLYVLDKQWETDLDRTDIYKGYLAGYHSRDAEIAELKKRLAKAEDPYGE